jgi:5'-nucleotidase
MARMPSRRTLLVVGGLVMAAVVTAAVIVSARDDAPPAIEVQLLALNDFHGNLEPPSGSSGRIGGVEAGGVEFLATQLRLLAEEAARPDTITVAAGDLIGASPLLSAAFHDEPTAEALGLAGLDLASVGNHEFDDGSDELLRIQNGGCHPQDGCADPARPYGGAAFQYLSANAFVTSTGQPLLPPYAVREVQGVRIGFIGMTLEGTPDVVTQAGISGLGFGDEAETANRYAAELQAQGVQAIVVLLHEGGAQTAATTSTDARTSPGRSSTSSPASRRRSTSWSAGTRTRPTTACSTAGSSPARVRSGGWSPTSTCGSTRRVVTSSTHGRATSWWPTTWRPTPGRRS